VTDAGRPLAEEDLHAYVDGFLDAECRAAVERYLQAHPDAAERVAAYGAQRRELREALAGPAQEPIPPRLNLARLVEARLTRRHTPWRAAAAVVLAVGLGGAGGWWAGSRPPAGIAALAGEAVASYAVYAVDKHRPVEIWAAQRDDLTRWVSNRLNRPVTAPDLSAAGYELLGGRLVASQHGAAALFVYQDASGRRLIIYVRPMSGGQMTPIEPIDTAAVDGCAWIDRGVGYSLVGAETYDKLLELSRQVRQEMRSLG
jgi:anti-sigma factor RsiW